MSTVPGKRVERSAERVSAAVKAEAARADMTHAQLAAVLGIDRRSVGRRLRGQQEFSPSELAAIASHLNIPVAVFFGEGVPA